MCFHLSTVDIPLIKQRYAIVRDDYFKTSKPHLLEEHIEIMKPK